MGFLSQAARRPHHSYVLAGPEGCGKQLAARAFAAALLCPHGGCGDCRHCRLALDDRHPNEFVVEPEGRDIHVETVREDIWHPAFRTAPEPGRKVFIVREADRLNPSAADVLLKVLEEPPADSVIMLLSARPHELPETVISRCHVVTFDPLSEEFVVQTLVEEDVEPSRALLAARLSGGNLGRARRLAKATDGLAFRDVGRQALGWAAEGPSGALAAADLVVESAKRYRKDLKESLRGDLAPFVNEHGRPEDVYRGAIRRIEVRHQRRVSRAERDYVDWVLLAVSSLLRDRIAAEVGGGDDVRINLDVEPDGALSLRRAAEALGAVEEARAALAEELNLNTRLLLERAFLRAGRGMAA